MKNILIIGLFLMSVASFGADFINFYGDISETIYSFELAKKISNKAGYFTPCWFQINTIKRSYGSSLSRRGGGGGTIKREQHRSNGKLDKTIIIVGYDLSKMADGNTITLEKGQKLYQIGIHTNAKGYTFEVYSFNKNDKPKFYLNMKQSRVSNMVSCPHCGQKIMLVPIQQ